MTRYEMDVTGYPWSFLNMFDRYIFICRFVGCVTVIGLIAACYRHFSLVAELLVWSLILNVIFQVHVIYQYERYAHQRYGVKAESPYTGVEYAITHILGIATVVTFIAGVMTEIGMWS